MLCSVIVWPKKFTLFCLYWSLSGLNPVWFSLAFSKTSVMAVSCSSPVDPVTKILSIIPMTFDSR